jgi:hypothetical protein
LEYTIELLSGLLLIALILVVVLSILGSVVAALRALRGGINLANRREALVEAVLPQEDSAPTKLGR